MNPQEIKLSLTNLSVEEVNAILLAIQELPGRICNPLSAKIKAEAEAQIAELQRVEEAQAQDKAV